MYIYILFFSFLPAQACQLPLLPPAARIPGIPGLRIRRQQEPLAGRGNPKIRTDDLRLPSLSFSSLLFAFVLLGRP